MSAPLKLRAEDAADYEVIGACLQDALVTAGDMAPLPEERAFIAVVTRFRWENCSETSEMPAAPAEPAADPALAAACASYERIACALRFDGVDRTRYRGLDLKERTRILELLTLVPEPGAVTLVFADGAEVRLEGEAVRCRLHDMGEAWPTQWRPRHLPQAEPTG